MALPRAEKSLVYAAIMTQGKYKGGTAATPKSLKSVYDKVRAAKGL